jgi:anti-sigma-K factor RskA
MRCAMVDELAAAYGLGAVEPEEERQISEHLAVCDRPHEEARRLIDAAAALAAGEEDVVASPQLRARILATAAATPQEQASAAPTTTVGSTAPAQPWWRLQWAPLAAAVAVVAAIGLGGWNLALRGDLADRDAALRLVASADVAHQASGSAGSGWVLESDGTALFVATELQALPADRIYELWLIDSGGVPLAVGTVDRSEGVIAIQLERSVGDATAFAVTVERERVGAPTSEPVLIAPLEG